MTMNPIRLEMISGRPNNGQSSSPGKLDSFLVLVAVLGLFLILGSPSLCACSVPVFRYALEAWPAAPYELTVVWEGKLDNRCQELIARLSGKSAPRDSFANLTIRTVDPRADAHQNTPEPGTVEPSEALLKVVLRYPAQAQAVSQKAIWSGPLSESTVNQMLDSPMRRRLVQRLAGGDSAVWVLLESGDPAQDNAAARVLQHRLEFCQRTLTLPSPDGERGDNLDDSIGTNELKVAFSMLRLTRNDPSEEILVRMLLCSEDDLSETKEPMAFPIYGRGRILYALVGKGITPGNIDEACSFLTGPCSCIIKEQNPGLDLLLSADWEHLIRPIFTSGLETFESARLPSVAGSSPLGDSASIPSKASAPRHQQQAHPSEAPVLKTILITAGGLGTLALVIGCLILAGKRN